MYRGTCRGQTTLLTVPKNKNSCNKCVYVSTYVYVRITGFMDCVYYYFTISTYVKISRLIMVL